MTASKDRFTSAAATASRAVTALIFSTWLVLIPLAVQARPSEDASPDEVWRFNAGEGEIYQLAARDDEVAVVFQQHSAAMDRPNDYQIALLSGATGKKRWQHSTGGIPNLSTPIAIDGDTVALIALDTTAVRYEVVAWNTASGELRWRCRLPDGAIPPYQLVAAKDGVLVASPHGTLWLIAKRTGKLSWTASVPPLAPGTSVRAESKRLLAFWRRTAAPYAAGVDCLSLASGRRLWRYQTSTAQQVRTIRGLSDSENVVILYSTSPEPSLMKGGGRVSAVSVSTGTGERQWTGTLPYAELTFLSRGSVYGVIGDTQLNGVEHAVWSADLPSGRLRGVVSASPALTLIYQAPAISDEVLAVEVRDGPSVRYTRVVWIDLRTAELLGEFEGTTHVGAPAGPILSGGHVICIVNEAHTVVALLPPKRPY